MRIGIFVSGIGVRPGFENIFSGHTQVAIQTAKLLQEAGHQVHMLVSVQHEGLVLPGTLPADLPVHLVTDGRWRGRVGEEFRRYGGYRPLAIARQLKQICALARQLRLDVLHLFGFERTSALAGMLRLMGLSCPTVVTVYEKPRSIAWSWLTRFSDQIIASTKSVQQHWISAGHNVALIKHGVIRDLLDELESPPMNVKQRRSILFWRVLAQETGGDLCLEVFDRLAPQFPEFSFDMALRPSVHEMAGAEHLAAKHANVRLFRFPYSEGISIAKLVTNSLCAIFPFRRLTIEPQMAIVETLAAGTACVGSNYASIPELIDSGRTGIIVEKDNPDAWHDALYQLLSNREKLEEMCTRANEEFQKNWNWEHYTPSLTAIYYKLMAARCPDRAAA